MKEFLAVLVLLATAFSGCTDTPGGTPDATTPATTPLPILPDPYNQGLNVSYDGRTTWGVCVQLLHPLFGPCASVPDPDYKGPWSHVVNGTKIRLVGNLTWTPTYPGKTTLSFTFGVVSPDRENLGSTMIEGESPLHVDISFEHFPNGSSVDFAGHHRTWTQTGVVDPHVMLPLDYHFEAVLYESRE